MKNQQESTYALLVRSEEKSRGVFEVVAYALAVLSCISSIWQFALQPVTLPIQGAKSLPAPSYSETGKLPFERGLTMNERSFIVLVSCPSLL